MLPLPARAALGDNAASVLTDQARMKGTLRSVDAHTYVMHEITASTGTVVREYVSPGGSGVRCRLGGPVPARSAATPWSVLSAGAAGPEGGIVGQQQPRARRAPVVIETPGLVMYETGHMRSFHGQAYIPQLVPQGVQASDIR